MRENHRRDRRCARLFGALVLVVVFTAGASQAWATFKTSAAATSTVSAHGLVTPVQPSCGGLGVASVTLSWPAPSDASQLDVFGSGFLVGGYEVGKSSSASGPFTYVDNGTSTSYTASTLLAGDTYFVIRSYKRSWRSSNSPARLVHVTLGLVTTCP